MQVALLKILIFWDSIAVTKVALTDSGTSPFSVRNHFSSHPTGAVRSRGGTDLTR